MSCNPSDDTPFALKPPRCPFAPRSEVLLPSANGLPGTCMLCIPDGLRNGSKSILKVLCVKVPETSRPCTHHVGLDGPCVTAEAQLTLPFSKTTLKLKKPLQLKSLIFQSAPGT